MMVKVGLIVLLVVAYVVLSRLLKSSIALLGHKKAVNEGSEEHTSELQSRCLI